MQGTGRTAPVRAFYAGSGEPSVEPNSKTGRIC